MNGSSTTSTTARPGPTAHPASASTDSTRAIGGDESGNDTGATVSTAKSVPHSSGVSSCGTVSTTRLTWSVWWARKRRISDRLSGSVLSRWPPDRSPACRSIR